MDLVLLSEPIANSILYFVFKIIPGVYATTFTSVRCQVSKEQERGAASWTTGMVPLQMPSSQLCAFNPEESEIL